MLSGYEVFRSSTIWWRDELKATWCLCLGDGQVMSRCTSAAPGPSENPELHVCAALGENRKKRIVLTVAVDVNLKYTRSK